MRSVVITTINAPSRAVMAFAALSDWELVVVGDLKTPADWQVAGATYLGVEDGRTMTRAIHEHLPWNHYGRKMLGYLEAIERGATTIAESDDDNLPVAGWDFPAFIGEVARMAPDLGYVNIYSLFTQAPIWPRGLPLRLVLGAPTQARSELETAPARVGVWQGLADGDPDVDAVYRLVVGTPVVFDQEAPVVLAPGTFSPFNSQNTAFAAEAFPLLYLPAFVTFRYTDILRAVVAQPVLQAAGLALGFTASTVFQERNEHDFMKDFESEIPMYLTLEAAHESVMAAVSSSATVTDNLHAAYAALERINVVTGEELRLLDAWSSDLQTLDV